MSEFIPIGTTGSFASYASIGKRRIESGDQLEVQWPDGTVEAITADVRGSSEPYQDHGNTYSMPVTRAYYTQQHHGMGASTPLHGIPARFVSDEATP